MEDGEYWLGREDDDRRKKKKVKDKVEREKDNEKEFVVDGIDYLDFEIVEVNRLCVVLGLKLLWL